QAARLTIGAEDLRATRGRPHQIEQDANRRGLARAVEAEEAEDLARLHLEREVAERDDAAVPLAKMLDADRRRSRPTLHAPVLSQTAAAPYGILPAMTRKHRAFLIIVAAGALVGPGCWSVPTRAMVTADDYARAERFLGPAVNPLVVGGSAAATWTDNDR